MPLSVPLSEHVPSDRTIGLFGGSFNPPHLAHLIIAELIREQFELDRILWIPNYQSPLKKFEEVASAEHRLAMTRLAVRGNDAFEVSDVEVQRQGVSYMIDTIGVLQEEHPDVDFSLIIGGDSLESFDAWHRPDDILERVSLIVYRRPGGVASDEPNAFASRATFADAPLLEISGTAVRERLHANRSVRYLVPEPVVDYIHTHGLYGAPRR